MKKKILVVDDDPRIQSLVKDCLSDYDYTVLLADDGASALRLALEEKPDLIVLDVELPDMLGFQVCKQLKLQREFRYVPVVMLTARTREADEISGFESGVDDYITKPFKPKLLIARVQAALERMENSLSANPLTQLPGNAIIFKDLEDRIAKGKPFSVFYFDLNNFKAFNDHYGFLQGDKAIQLVANLLSKHFSTKKESSPFVGHVGGDDFIAILDTYNVEDLCKTLIQEFDQEILPLYSEEDRKQQKISAVDRNGTLIDYPIMGLAIAVVTNKLKSFKHPGEISLIAGELKKQAKMSTKSAYVVDRRA